jgi:DNA-binding HxlR family transcriptional regulator
MQDRGKPLTSGDIAAAPARPVAADESTLSPEERAALAIDVAWVDWRSQFRRKVLASGVLKRAWRSVFEADMIFSIVAHRWLSGQLITHKELATYFEQFATEATVSRHLSDMEEAGMIVRETDPNDRRRIFLRPTERLETVGREFLQARIHTMRAQGFVWSGADETDRKTAIDPA